MPADPINDSENLSGFISQLTDHQSALRGFLSSLLPQNDVRDVLQNTNLALWERRNSFEMGSNFQAWAFTIARYRALEYRRILQKQKKVTLSEDIIGLIADESFNRTSDRMHALKSALNTCIQRLKTRDQKLIQARYFSKTPLEEYAKIDGRSPASLRVILTRVRSNLRSCIDNQLIKEGDLL